ncbi:hypothetical protein [Rathayibacter agropyri]|nr:hypothetical protein [Rathayibacter agropyri]
MLDLAYLLGVLALFSLLGLAAQGVEKLGGAPAPARSSGVDR